MREKLVHIESDDQQLRQNEINPNDQGVQQQQQLPQLNHHFHQSHSHKHHGLPHFRHQRRPSRSDEARDAAVLRKWKKSKAILSRRPSTESESSDQSEAVPEIRVINANAAEEPATNNEKPRVQPPPPTIVVGSTLKVSSSPVAGTNASVHKTTQPGLGEPSNGTPEDGNGCVVQQPVKHKARLKLAQILYKEARRRRQKYLEEIQNQQE